MIYNTFAKIRARERASVVALWSSCRPPRRQRSSNGAARYGPVSTVPMSPTPCHGDAPPPLQSDHARSARHDRAHDQAGPGPVGGPRGQLSHGAALVLPGQTMGGAVVVRLPSSGAPCRSSRPPGGRCRGRPASRPAHRRPGAVLCQAVRHARARMVRLCPLAGACPRPALVPQSRRAGHAPRRSERGPPGESAREDATTVSGTASPWASTGPSAPRPGRRDADAGVVTAPTPERRLATPERHVYPVDLPGAGWSRWPAPRLAHSPTVPGAPHLHAALRLGMVPAR